MKNSFFTLLIAAVAATSFSHCTKEKKEDAVNDPLKNTVWTGEFKHASRPVVETYSIIFDDKGNFEWEELEGTVTGTYRLTPDGKGVTLNFSSTSVVTAGLSNAGVLDNIVADGNINGWRILNGKLNGTTEQALTSTAWKNLAEERLTFFSATSLNIYGYPATFTRSKGGIKFSVYAGSLYHFYLVPDGNTLKGIYKESNGSFYMEQKLTRM